MQRLTPIGKLFIILLILAGLYGGFRVLQSQGIIGKTGDTTQADSTQRDAPKNGGSDGDYAEDPEEAEPTKTPSSESTSPSNTAASFKYTPQGVENGKLKGVVELGASGFNSFIIKVDAQKNWQLEKAEFGNSLVLENMATDDDIRAGLKKYIGNMLDFGVYGRDIHFVVSSGAAKAETTVKITNALKQLKYQVNQVTAEQEGTLGLKSVLPEEFEDKAFVVDIGSGNTKISWKENDEIKSLETYGAKYFQTNVDGKKVYEEVGEKAKKVPASHRKTCFIIGGVPFELAKAVRKGKERYTVLNAPDAYNLDNAKSKAGLNIYKSIAEATDCQQFVFDWDANFTIGFLLDLPL